MALVPDQWVIEGLFEHFTLALPALRANEQELALSPSGDMQVNGQRCTPVPREFVRSLRSVQPSKGGVRLLLVPVLGVHDVYWFHPPRGLMLEEITLTRDVGGLGHGSALAYLAGGDMARRKEWYEPAPLRHAAHPRGSVWFLNTGDLGREPGGIKALVDLGQGLAFSTSPFAGSIDWAKIELLPRGERPSPLLVEDGLPVSGKQ